MYDTPPITVERYSELLGEVAAAGYGHEFEWAQGVLPVSDPLLFWQDFAWVVLNSGMKNQVAAGIWRRVRPAVMAGRSASTVSGHADKAAAIERVFRDRHLVRLAGDEGVDSLCRRLAAATGHRVATVDLVLWRAANLGLV